MICFAFSKFAEQCNNVADEAFRIPIPTAIPIPMPIPKRKSLALTFISGCQWQESACRVVRECQGALKHLAGSECTVHSGHLSKDTTGSKCFKLFYVFLGTFTKLLQLEFYRKR